MRQLEEKVISAFILGLNEQAGSLSSLNVRGVTFLIQHGNVIAERNKNGRIRATMAGWPTPTAKSRLNALCTLLNRNTRFWQEQGRQYFGKSDGHFQHITADQWVTV